MFISENTILKEFSGVNYLKYLNNFAADCMTETRYLSFTTTDIGQSNTFIKLNSFLAGAITGSHTLHAEDCEQLS